MKRDRWSEDDVLGLPSGELDYFDRKSGTILKDADFLKKLAKCVSAFANSGGGHLVIGIRDDGTLDGVPKIYKGRQSAKDWLEQIIPELVSYPLQDFRVHEVDPSTPTAIPADNVVIVVDIGDSESAPHQDTFSKIYYHRVGGHSVPAPHLYLEILRSREKYPSKEIVCAWRDSAINPLLSSIAVEQKYLEQSKWTWNRWHGPKELRYVSDRSTYSANQEQFLEAHSEIQALMDEHDKAVREVNRRYEALFRAIMESELLLDVYLKTTTSEALQSLKAMFYDELSNCNTDESIMHKIFPFSDKREDHLAVLAENIVNKAGDFNPGDRTTAPIWNTHKECFLELLDYKPIVDYWAAAQEARNELLQCVETLIGLLRSIRTELTRRHGVPVEAHEQPLVLYRDSIY